MSDGGFDLSDDESMTCNQSLPALGGVPTHTTHSHTTTTTREMCLPQVLLKQRAVVQVNSSLRTKKMLTVDQAIHKHEADVDHSVQQAYVSISQGNYAAAMESLSSAAAQRPSCVQTLYALTCLSALVGDASSCSEYILQAVESTEPTKKPLSLHNPPAPAPLVKVKQEEDMNAGILHPQLRYRMLARQNKAPKEVRHRIRRGEWTNDDIMVLIKGVRWVVDNTTVPDDPDRVAERLQCPWLPMKRVQMVDELIKSSKDRTVGPPLLPSLTQHEEREVPVAQTLLPAPSPTTVLSPLKKVQHKSEVSGSPKKYRSNRQGKEWRGLHHPPTDKERRAKPHEKTEREEPLCLPGLKGAINGKRTGAWSDSATGKAVPPPRPASCRLHELMMVKKTVGAVE